MLNHTPESCPFVNPHLGHGPEMGGAGTPEAEGGASGGPHPRAVAPHAGSGGLAGALPAWFPTIISLEEQGLLELDLSGDSTGGPHTPPHNTPVAVHALRGWVGGEGGSRPARVLSK